MSTPHRDDEPDEPADGVAADHRSPGPQPGPQREPSRTPDDEEALWHAIVANFGDRAELDDEPDGGDLSPGHDSHGAPDSRGDHGPAARLGHPAGTGRPQSPRVPERGSADPDETDLARGPEERFVPPTPPPFPLPGPARLLAWLGVLGIPVAVLVVLLVGISTPSWVGTLLMVWFVGGFGYLVARMRRDHHDPDDGAVV